MRGGTGRGCHTVFRREKSLFLTIFARMGREESGYAVARSGRCLATSSAGTLALQKMILRIIIVDVN
jgi:hypothetical protein